MMIITMTSTSDEENVTSSDGDLTEHASSPDRPVSPEVSCWKTEGSRGHLHDHNYAARLTAKVVTAQKLNSAQPLDSKVDGGVLEDVTRDGINKTNLQREEILKKNRQLTEASAVLMEYQMLQKQIAIVEKKNADLNALLELKQAEKTDLQLQFDKFRTSATNVCCGVNVFIDEFRKQFKRWCITNDIRSRDQAQFYSGLDCIAALVQDKLRVWLEDGLVTQTEVDRTKKSITELAQLAGSEAQFMEEDNSNLAAIYRSEDAKLVVEPKDGVKTTCGLGKLPDEQKEEVSNKHEEEVEIKEIFDKSLVVEVVELSEAGEDGEVVENVYKSKEVEVRDAVEKNFSSSGTTTDTVTHGYAKSIKTGPRPIFQCICGMNCKTVSGLKLHIRNLSKLIKFPSKSRRNQNKLKTVENSHQSAENSKKSSAKNDLINKEESLSANCSRHKPCPARKKPKPPSSTEESPIRSHMPSVVLPETPASPLPSSRKNKVPSCSTSSVTTTSLESLKPLDGSTPKQNISSEFSNSVIQKPEKMQVSRMSHSAHPSNSLECQCGYKAKYKCILNRHIKYYSPDGKFSCAMCPRLFLNQGYLNNHYRVIHKIKQPIIAIVRLRESEIINQTKSLPNKKTETEEIEISKPNFSKRSAFRTLTKLKKRRNAARRKRKLLRITAKERLFCQFCHRRFPHLRDLVSHMARKIHGGEPFVNYQSTAKKTKKNSIIKATVSGASGSKMPSTSHSLTDSPSRSKSTPRRSNRLSTKPISASLFNLCGEKLVKMTTEVQGERCDCGQKCDKKKYRAGCPPPHCTICSHVFVCMDFLRIHLLEVHNIVAQVPNVGGGKMNGKLVQTDEMNESHSKVLPTPAGNRRKRKSKPVRRPPLIIPVKEDKVVKEDKIVKEDKVLKVEKLHHRQIKGRGIAASTFKCSCGKVYTHRKSFGTHLIESRLGRVFKCPVCGYGFSKNYNLILHVKRYHPKQLAKVHRCSCRSCGKTFKSSKDRIYHRKKEHGVS